MTRRSLASRLTRYAPSVRRAHRQYATGESTRAVMEQLRAQPAPYDPPERWPSDVTVTARRLPQGWPVYDVAPAGREVRAVVLFLHGGAYFREIRPPHWRLAAHLASTVPARVVVPIYPLAPAATADVVVPVAVEVASTLVAAEAPGPVFLLGDSAGAGMALAVAQELWKEGRPPAAGLVLVSPWVDITCTDPRMAGAGARDPWLQAPGLQAAGTAYRGPLAADHPWVSPITGPLAALPPMLVLTGTDDILTVDAQRLVSAVTEAGGADGSVGAVDLVEAPGQIHDYALHATPEGRAARRLITTWLQGRLA